MQEIPYKSLLLFTVMGKRSICFLIAILIFQLLLSTIFSTVVIDAKKHHNVSPDQKIPQIPMFKNITGITQGTPGWFTYEDNDIGFKIDYPENWVGQQRSISTIHQDRPIMLPDSRVTFDSPHSYGQTPKAEVSISVLNASKFRYLDVNDLQVKNRTAHDLVSEALKYIENNNNDPTRIITYKPIKNTETILGENKYPAWRLDYIFSSKVLVPIENYNLDIYSIIGDKVYRLSFLRHL